MAASARRQQRKTKTAQFFHDHSLSIAAVSILAMWFVLYCFSNPNTHLGAFFGNAIADWSGTVVIVIGTKFLIEKGSKESHGPRTHCEGLLKVLYDHSLLIFLVSTGAIWAWLFWRSDPNAKWGTVAGNVLSEWVQTAGIVYLTKKLIERGSAESKSG